MDPRGEKSAGLALGCVPTGRDALVSAIRLETNSSRNFVVEKFRDENIFFSGARSLRAPKANRIQEVTIYHSAKKNFQNSQKKVSRESSRNFFTTNFDVFSS